MRNLPLVSALSFLQPTAFAIRNHAVKLRFLASCSQQPSWFATVRTQKLGLAARYRLPSQLVLSGSFTTVATSGSCSSKQRSNSPPLSDAASGSRFATVTSHKLGFTVVRRNSYSRVHESRCVIAWKCINFLFLEF